MPENSLSVTLEFLKSDEALNRKIIVLINTEQLIYSYLSSLYTIELTLTIPIIAYGVFLTYIIHISKNADINTRQNNKSSLNFKKRLLILMTLYFLYRIFLINYLGLNIDAADLFLYIFLQVFEIVISLLTPFVIREVRRKTVRIPFKNSFTLFWLIITLKIILEIFYEFYYNVFFHYVTFSLIGLIGSGCLSYMFYQYPVDDLLMINNNEVYFELQYLHLLTPTNYKISDPSSQDRGEKKDYNSSIKKFKPLTPVMKLKDRKNSFNSQVIKGFSDEISLDDISHNQPERLPHYPKIDISIKGDYKYFQTNFLHPEFSPLNTNNFNNRKDGRDQRGEFYHNFFFQIIVSIKDKNIQHLIKRSIKDFLDLEHDIKSEFAFEKYSKKLTEHLPHLKLPKNHQSIDFFKNYKINFEMFLKNIVSEPSFITDDVLNFLEVDDKNMFFSYDIARKKNLNVGRSNDDMLTASKFNFDLNNVKIELENRDKIIRESISRIKRDDTDNHNNGNGRSKYEKSVKNETILNLHSINNSGKKNPMSTGVSPHKQDQIPFSYPKSKRNEIKFNILEIKQDLNSNTNTNTTNTTNTNSNQISSNLDLVVVIRISQSVMFRIINKKLNEVIEMVTELSNINKNNENIKNLLKMFNELYLPTQTFTSNPYPTSNLKFSSLLENVIQNSYDNLKLYQCSHIINEFYNEFVDESRAISRCESFLGNPYDNIPNDHYRNNFSNNLISNNFTNNKLKEKKDSDYYLSLIFHGKVKSVEVNIADSLFLLNDFKSNVFYVTLIKLRFHDDTNEVIKKKFKYKELNQYINQMAFRLKITDKLVKGSLYYRNDDDKIKFRKKELQGNIEIVFKHLNIEDNREWMELLERDGKYQKIKNEKNERETVDKPSIVFNQRTDSKESFLGFNIRDSLLN